MLRRFLVATLVSVFVALTVLQAGELEGMSDSFDPAPAPGELIGFRFFWENDLFGLDGDKYYTNGLKFEWWFAGPATDAPVGSFVQRELADWCARVPKAERKDGCYSDVSFAFGQTFYTPTDITIAAPQPNDRPWAGYLFVSSSLVAQTGFRQHSFEGQFGIIGPESGARYVQTKWHEIIRDEDRPAGWGNQIPNQLAVEATYNYKRRFKGEGNLKYADVILGGGGAVGTVQVFANANVTFRFGPDLEGFGKTKVEVRNFRPGGDVESAVPNPRKPSRAFAFVSFEERWVPFNTFIRGGTVRRVPTSIVPVEALSQASVGFLLPLTCSRRCGLAYELIWLSEEFKGDGSHRYGSVVLNCGLPRSRYKTKP